MRKFLVLSVAIFLVYSLVNINVVSALSLMGNGSKRQLGFCPMWIVCDGFNDRRCTSNPIYNCGCK